MVKAKTCDNCYNNIKAHGAFMGMDYCMEAKTDINESGITTEEIYQKNGVGCECWHEQMQIFRNGKRL